MGEIAIDITDELAARQALVASDHRFAAFLNHVPVRAAIYDVEDRLVWIGQESARFWGCSPEEMIDQRWAEAPVPMLLALIGPAHEHLVPCEGLLPDCVGVGWG
ncbi:hypothetical protein GCM10011609_29160 [Lentzea pudingi]|uniref:PAS domain-containing protein n=1 Tax=Lentzea pudingi TaxID=1789439 RepID=A0ABQ2HSK3_9PSEU|nr:hypothetical protein [Lentzea pudingi]GGM90363.1 hypothetical protein GCM10011609_29160 [Lentzea pudingi]